MLSHRVTALLRCLLLAWLALGSLDARAQDISRHERFTGNINFVATGGSLRTESNDDDACAVGNSSSAVLSGIPSSATILAAYLYWGGSGNTTDSQVRLNNSNVNAQRTFAVTVPDPNRRFFGGFADVTSRITGNRTLTFDRLSVDEGGNYCSSGTVIAGWGIVVIYSDANEPLRAINVFDGLESFFGSAVTLSPDGFRIPNSSIDGKIAVITWDGDPANSGASNGYSEALSFNGTPLDDGIVAPGSSPWTQQYDGTINSAGIATSHGVDVDTYDVSALLSPGQTSATTHYSSGGDRVFLTAQVVSVTSTPAIAGSDLSTSTKSVVDLNGGDANPGDTLRYTITLNETAGVAASGVSVSDHVPANTSGFAIVAIPAGATNASTGVGTGANGVGLLDVTGINVPAGGTVAIAFDVQVATGMPPGATISNTATIVNPSGAAANPSAPQVIVSESQIPGSGTKQLYLLSDLSLHRTRPTSSQPDIAVSGGTRTWTLSPALQQPVTLAAGNMPVKLLLTRIGGSFFGSTDRTVSIRLRNSSLGVLAQVNNVTLDNVPQNAPAEFTIALNLPAQVTAPAGSTFILDVTYTAFPGFGVNVHPYSAGNTSRVELNSLSVINVDSIGHYDAAHPGGGVTTAFSRGATVFMRSVVSDPFGSFDISEARVSILAPDGATLVNAAAMTPTPDTGGASRIFEYAFVVPANAALGNWTTRIVAHEGVEGVTDVGLAVFSIATPALNVQKLSNVVSDPVNLTANPKSIPGSVQLYTIVVTNTGQGAIDASSLVITDVLPTNLELCIASACGGTLTFVDGSPASGLSFNYGANVSYSSASNGAAPYNHTPSPTPEGYDPNIRGIRIAPAGAMSGANGSGAPSFTLRFYARVK